MKRTRTTILAWTLSFLCILLATAGLVVWMQTGAVQSGPAVLLRKALGTYAVPVLFSITGALIISRQPANRVGWLLMLAGWGDAVSTSFTQFLVEPRTVLTPVLWLVIWIDNWAWIPFIFPIILIPLHFPSGRPPSPRWRWVNWLAVAMWILLISLEALQLEMSPYSDAWMLDNPIGFLTPDIFEGPFIRSWMLGLLAMTLGSVASLVVRYRRAGLVEKEQIKWLLYAALLFGMVYAMLVIINAGTAEWTSPGWLELLLYLSVMGLPVAITIAILRYRLFDIDVIIRKTAVYAVLTILLGLVYFGVIILLQTLFESMTGEQSPLILVVSTLLIAFLFAPLRRWVQGIIDRRFYRSKYDAQRVLEMFAQTARDETDLDQLTGELVIVLQETLQPQAISLWTAEGRITDNG